jgi:signal transduction histidine kinase
LTPTIILRPGAGLPEGNRYAIAFDARNKLWFSIPGVGVGRTDPEQEKLERFYTEKDGDFLTSIRSIMVDGNENVWLGDFWRGIAVISSDDSGSHIRHYTKQDGLPGDGIRALLEGSDGKVWIGTRYNGIAVYHEGRFQSIGMDDGMRSNAVWSLVEDSRGRILAGTSMDLQAISNITMKPVLSAEELTEPVIGNCGFLPDGTLWGVSADRLLLYESEDTTRLAVPPLIHLTRAFVNETPVTLGKQHQLAHDENNWRIEFAGLSFRDEKAVRYTYRLYGLDNRWREPTPSREVTYASLAPGEYTFQVKAITRDGVESTAPATLSFVINAPVWTRWWFITAAAFLLSGVVAVIIRARVRRLLEIERIRTGIATDLHDDIGSGLTRIAILSEMAAKQAAPAPRAQPVGTADEGALLTSLEKMGAFARELHDAMSDVVWSIDPQHDTLKDVARRLREFATEVCQENNIHLRDLLAAESLTLSPELLRAVLLIGKEALSNTARHAECTTLTMSLKVAGSDIILVVEDNGAGFQLDTLPRVNGLANMRRRAEKVGGALHVQSAPGEGTRVEAHIPIRRKPEHLFS